MSSPSTEKKLTDLKLEDIYGIPVTDNYKLECEPSTCSLCIKWSKHDTDGHPELGKGLCYICEELNHSHSIFHSPISAICKYCNEHLIETGHCGRKPNRIYCRNCGG